MVEEGEETAIDVLQECGAASSPITIIKRVKYFNDERVIDAEEKLLFVDNVRLLTQMDNLRLLEHFEGEDAIRSTMIHDSYSPKSTSTKRCAVGAGRGAVGAEGGAQDG
jgi:hypothetical protein